MEIQELKDFIRSQLDEYDIGRCKDNCRDYLVFQDLTNYV